MDRQGDEGDGFFAALRMTGGKACPVAHRCAPLRKQVRVADGRVPSLHPLILDP